MAIGDDFGVTRSYLQDLSSTRRCPSVLSPEPQRHDGVVSRCGDLRPPASPRTLSLRRRCDPGTAVEPLCLGSLCRYACVHRKWCKSDKHTVMAMCYEVSVSDGDPTYPGPNSSSEVLLE